VEPRTKSIHVLLFVYECWRSHRSSFRRIWDR